MQANSSYLGPDHWPGGLWKSNQHLLKDFKLNLKLYQLFPHITIHTGGRVDLDVHEFTT